MIKMINLDLKLQSLYDVMRKDENIQKLYKYYKNKKYLVLLLKQINGLIRNLKSISLLIDTDNIEDSFTIFRKYLETYFIVMSIVEHPDLVEDYIIHDNYLSMMACKNDLEKVKAFIKGKPDGFLEYGYLDKYLNVDADFKYTARRAAEVANVSKYYNYYKICDNFVHNNLTSANVDLKNGKKKIIGYITNTIDTMEEKFKMLFCMT